MVVVAALLAWHGGTGQTEPEAVTVEAVAPNVDLRGALLAAEEAPALPVDPCWDYDQLEAGAGEPSRQEHFNLLDARGYARWRLACVYAGGETQWNCLDHLWGPLESGWNHHADNPYSSAYGIPQALPGSKMGPGWRTDPRVQVRWGLGYVNRGGRYDSPCDARAVRLRRGAY